MANRPHPIHTRRQVLAAGSLGLVGMGQASLSSGQAAERAASAAPARPGALTGDSPVLRPGKASAVGMSAAGLRRISDRLREETSGGGVGSASILVARQGKVVLHQGFGRLNPSPGAPATRPDTIYLLASISKPVSVCGLMLLVEEGRVALSDPVQRHLPEFQGRIKERVRVGHLLSHTSGLPDMVPENTRLRRAQAPLSRFVAAALRTPLLFEPGTRFSYQSMGTLLAAEIAERISGMRLRDLLGARIFQPLDMRRTVLGLEGLDDRRDGHLPGRPRHGGFPALGTQLALLAGHGPPLGRPARDHRRPGGAAADLSQRRAATAKCGSSRRPPRQP